MILYAILILANEKFEAKLKEYTPRQAPTFFKLDLMVPPQYIHSITTLSRILIIILFSDIRYNFSFPANRLRLFRSGPAQTSMAKAFIKTWQKCYLFTHTVKSWFIPNIMHETTEIMVIDTLSHRASVILWITVVRNSISMVQCTMQRNSWTSQIIKDLFVSHQARSPSWLLKRRNCQIFSGQSQVLAEIWSRQIRCLNILVQNQVLRSSPSTPTPVSIAWQVFWLQ